jgi:hypothetical protein
MTTVFAAFPSYNGITEEEAKRRCAEPALVAKGHGVGVCVIVGEALLDVVRASLTTVFMKSKADLVLYMDDDVAIDGESICKMVELAATYPVISAPCRMRGDGRYNVHPTSMPDEHGMMVCSWTGLGCVLVTRKVIEKMYAAYPRLWFKRATMPEATLVGLFNSVVVDAREFDPNTPDGVGMHLGDDQAFSYRLRAQHIPIHAYVDAKTDHRGLPGNMRADMEAVDKAARGAGLVGPGGNPL